MLNENMRDDQDANAPLNTCFTPKNRVEVQPSPSLVQLYPDLQRQQVYAQMASADLYWGKSGAGIWRERATLAGIWLLVLLASLAICVRLLTNDVAGPLPAAALLAKDEAQPASRASGSTMMMADSDSSNEQSLQYGKDIQATSLAELPLVASSSFAASDEALKSAAPLQIAGTWSQDTKEIPISAAATFGIEEKARSLSASAKQAPDGTSPPVRGSRKKDVTTPRCDGPLQAMQLCEVQQR
jgi:hypothetical protein